MGQWSKWTNVLKWSIKQLNRSYYCPHQRFQPQQIICICADICTFPDLHYRHEQTSAPFDKLPIWSIERGAERTFPLLGGHFVDIFCFFCCKRYFFLAGKGLCYVVVPCFCRDMSFVAFTRFFGLILMQTFMQTLRILCRFLHEKMLVGTSGPHFDNSPHLTHMKTFLVVVHNLQKPIGGPASDTRLTVYIWQPFEARI